MNDYKLSPDALVMISGSSKGTQSKYYEKNYWYKKNESGYEGNAEYLVSQVLSCSNVSSYVEYEKCTINGAPGCRSKNFLGQNENFMSFQRLYNIYNGANLSEVVLTLNDARSRIELVKSFIMDILDFDISDYLSRIISLDMLTLNTDRHFNNLGLIVNPISGKCHEAPIFDNGAALLSNYNLFPADEDLITNIENAKSLPFSSSFEVQAHECGIGLQIDYKKLERKLNKEPESRALNVIRYQLERYRKILDHNI